MERTVAFLLVCCCLTALAAQAAEDRPLAFVHVTVIDATGSAPRSDAAVLIVGGRIAGVGRTGQVTIPKGAQVVQAQGKFLIPGLWNMHLHAGSYNDAKRALPALLASGITGVRDMGAPLEDVLRLRAETAVGGLLGPRLVVCGPLLQGPLPFRMPLLVSLTSEFEARQTVTRLKDSNVDFVKVQDALPRDLYFAIADQARRERRPLAGHVPPSILAREAADAGQVSIEHLGGQFLGVLLGCSRLESALHAQQVSAVEALRLALERGDPPTKSHLRAPFVRAVLESYDDLVAASLFSRFVERGTWHCPTLVALKTLWDGEKQGLTEEDLLFGARVFARDLEVVASMHHAGVRLLAGTDGPYAGKPGVLQDELALLVEAGLSPLQALQTATLNPAVFLHQSSRFGTLEPGKTADLVLLDGDPLEDIRNTQRVAGVILGGRLLTKAALQEIAARAPATSAQRSLVAN